MRKTILLGLALSAGALSCGWSSVSNDHTLKDDPFSRKSRSKGEKARNKKNRWHK